MLDDVDIILGMDWIAAHKFRMAADLKQHTFQPRLQVLHWCFLQPSGVHEPVPIPSHLMPILSGMRLKRFLKMGGRLVAIAVKAVADPTAPPDITVSTGISKELKTCHLTLPSGDLP
jgi:hypothetical protein